MVVHVLKTWGGWQANVIGEVMSICMNSHWHGHITHDQFVSASNPPTSEMMTLVAKIAALRTSIEALIDMLYDRAAERDRPGNIRAGI